MHVLFADDERHAHINFYYGLKDRDDVGSSSFFFHPEGVLSHAAENKVDCAFLDINFCGDMNGLDVAIKLKEINPHTEIVFITGHDEFARDAYRVGACAYMGKPYNQEELDAILDKLQSLTKIHRAEEAMADRPKSQVQMKTFGNFDLLVDNKPVAFKNAKAKELLAYLVHQNGGTVSSAQLFLTLWEQQEYTSNTSTYVRRTIRSLRDELEALGLDDILLCKRNCYSVDTSRFMCDYYSLMSGNSQTAHLYNGEFMHQYPWGEHTVPLLARKANALISAESQDK